MVTPEAAVGVHDAAVERPHPSGEQQNAIVAAISSGSSTRRSSWWSARSPGRRRRRGRRSPRASRCRSSPGETADGGDAGADQVGGEALHQADDGVLGRRCSRRGGRARGCRRRRRRPRTGSRAGRARRAWPGPWRPRCSRRRGRRRPSSRSRSSSGGLPQRPAAGDHGGRGDGDVEAAPGLHRVATAASSAARSRTSATTGARRRRRWRTSRGRPSWPAARPRRSPARPRRTRRATSRATVAAPMPPAAPVTRATRSREPLPDGACASHHRREQPRALGGAGARAGRRARRWRETAATPPAAQRGQDLAQRLRCCPTSARSSRTDPGRRCSISEVSVRPACRSTLLGRARHPATSCPSCASCPPPAERREVAAVPVDEDDPVGPGAQRADQLDDDLRSASVPIERRARRTTGAHRSLRRRARARPTPPAARAAAAVATASAMTVSVSSGRCGPCCSIEPDRHQDQRGAPHVGRGGVGQVAHPGVAAGRTAWSRVVAPSARWKPSGTSSSSGSSSSIEETPEAEQGGVDAAAQHVEDVLDTRLAVGGETPQVGAADHAPRAHRGRAP